uniref:Anoctamin n=1 Tax=Plectus sambesii TaxID=2011161 RepID=A0A914XQP7_9BILA
MSGLFGKLKRKKKADEEDVTVPLIFVNKNERSGPIETSAAISSDAASLGSFKRHTYGTLAFGPPSIATKTLAGDVDKTIFTSQGHGIIDFVLAYQPLDMNASQTMYREVFESKLREHGLYLEHEDLAQSQDGKTCFVKVHAPWETLARMAEINRVKMPIQQSDMEDSNMSRLSNFCYKTVKFLFCGRHPLDLEPSFNIPAQPPYFTLEFQRARFRHYLIQDPNTFFSQTQRINIVWDVIERTTISGGEIETMNGERLHGHRVDDAVSMSFLLRKGVYCAVYPLHDGEPQTSSSEATRGPKKPWPLRPWLYETWARPGRWYKRQPIDQIRAYFGEKVAIYFSWLGFYTAMLIPFSIVGLIVFIYGLIHLPDDTPHREICHTNASELIICRKCGSTACPFKLLKADCAHAGATAIFNNFGTVFFAFFASLWAVFYLELWKRKQARLACKWDTADISPYYEPPRPEYISNATKKRRHPITQEWEPHVPARSRVQNLMASVASISFLVCLAIAVVFGVIMYKVIMVSIYNNWDNPAVQAVGSDMFSTITASIINAVLIMILERIYGKIAWVLTEKEFPRTDSAFENSYTYKMYIFQFVNYYATLFYLAFLQDILSTTPKHDTLLTDRCPPTGCTFSVTTQLAIILILKQANNVPFLFDIMMTISNAMEIGVPVASNWWKRRKNIHESVINPYTRYEKDFDLMPHNGLPLFSEYFEMVMQFGYVTMFVAAFPLAPLFALFNNIVELRIDALKFVKETRRVLPERAANIGNWLDILKFVTYLSVLTNALFIAFTTDLIDRFTYMSFYSKDGSLSGYIEWSLAVFETSDWGDPSLMLDGNSKKVTECRYHGYFTDSDHMYSHSERWWRVMLSKMVFVLVFEHLVFFIMALIQYIMPDVPENVTLHIARNRYVNMVAAYKTDRARNEAARRMSSISSAKPRPLTPPLHPPSMPSENSNKANVKSGATLAPKSIKTKSFLTPKLEPEYSIRSEGSDASSSFGPSASQISSKPSVKGKKKK